MKNKILKLSPADNVLVALTDLRKGELVSCENEEFLLQEPIPAKHKFFMNDMASGDSVFMYGVLVGKLLHAVSKGTKVHTGNTRHAAEPYRYRGYDYKWQAPDTSRFRGLTFNGFHRSDGRVGTANYWIFIPTVFCENRNLDVIREVLENELGYSATEKYRSYTNSLLSAYKDARPLSDAAMHSFGPDPTRTDRPFKNVDGIRFLKHEGGCGGIRQDAAVLGKLLAAYANHPNVGGVTILSLGCQNLQVTELLEEIKTQNPGFNKPMVVLEQQQAGTEEELITTAIRKTFEGLIAINQQERKPAPLDKLCIGVKCGGSDGFSGISANPAVGYCADLLVALGGKIILAEFPELCGVEQDLLDRTEDPGAAQKFIDLMKNYESIVTRAGSGFHMNPSPGNIRDGLITDAMKSAGAAKKGGTSPITDVLDYTEPAVKPGLNLLCTPGNDVEATTGKAASGATLILFTTGLGTPTGNPICPTIKIATNSVLAKKMKDIIDIDTGAIIDGTKTISEMGEDILHFCIHCASGEIVPKAVLLNQNDFIPWKRGVSL
ncbi:UxaA family hydrolase [Flavihumibacter stibioxidans]|uniref:Altronate hydrolase n=1 Tax=Flavihumibacter stibioxidans TaxID=1834163 RepID=A0ABR7M947_9BACT|nr:altronate dehydratase family protein [Flavihumibacter stibioxidans]MBC6491482.1 altronate hydrolase [Flavihumibacter stibioxidans]